MPGIFSAILAIPGLGELLRGLAKLLGLGALYWKGRQDARTDARLARAEALLRLNAERQAIDRRVSRDAIDVVRERLRADHRRRRGIDERGR